MREIFIPQPVVVGPIKSFSQPPQTGKPGIFWPHQTTKQSISIANSGPRGKLLKTSVVGGADYNSSTLATQELMQAERYFLFATNHYGSSTSSESFPARNRVGLEDRTEARVEVSFVAFQRRPTPGEYTFWGQVQTTEAETDKIIRMRLWPR